MTQAVINPQIQFGEVDISKIKFHPKSRDDIPKILKGLPYIYVTPALRKAIFDLLEHYISPGVNKNNGRPGMALWKIFVMGVLRLDLNCDYDRLQHLVNYDSLIRNMLGHGTFDESAIYEFQTIKDNVSLLTPELLDKINQEIVKTGHQLLKKKDIEALRGRCDSFVVETDVHFPTDINLLYDAVRKTIKLTAKLCEQHGLSDWRQSAYNVRHVKRFMRLAQHKKRAHGKTEAQKKKYEQALVKAHKDYIGMAQKYLSKAAFTIKMLEGKSALSIVELILREEIQTFIQHGTRQIDQIERRAIKGETIPHDEKVFSLFQPHTEWIMKGKAGVPVELGVKVCIVEDHHQFVLHHQTAILYRNPCDKKWKLPLATILARFVSTRRVPEWRRQMRILVAMTFTLPPGSISRRAKKAKR